MTGTESLKLLIITGEIKKTSISLMEGLKLNTKRIDEKFHRIVELLKNQNELEVIEDIIPCKIKKDFIEGWEEAQ